MIRARISLDESLYQAAKREAKAQGISLAEMCRQALRNGLADGPTDAPWMRYAGRYASGDVHASSTVETVVHAREKL